MSSWNDVISTYGGGELSYSFPESTIATLRFYAKLGGGDYTGSIILRVSDGSSHHLQLEGSSADTLKIVEYPGESIIVDNIRAHKMDWQQVVIVLTPVGIRVYQNGSLTGSGYISSPLAFTQLLFYANQAQLYDELTHIPVEVSEAHIERWGLQDWPLITADPGGYYEEQFALGTIEEPTGEWLSNPPETDVTEYLWMRRRWVAGDGTPGSWATPVRIKGDTGDVGPEGPQGPMGNPGQLGLYAEGTTLYLKGFADDGTLTAENGNIYGDGQRLVVPAYSQNLTADGQGYVIFNGSTVQFAKLVADGTSKRWIPYNGGDSIEEGFWVIGSFTKDGSSIYNLQITYPEKSQQFERSHFMDILASGDMQNINVWAQANGIEQVFKRIAVLEAFVNELTSNEAFIQNLFAQNATIAGTLKSDNYSETGGIPTAGFRLDGPTSIVKMFEAVFGDQCTFYGKLLHSLLQTREAVSADAITIPEKTHWTRQSFIDFLTSKSLPSDALVPCTGTYNGSAITHVIKATGTRIRLFTLQSLNASISYTVPYIGSTYLYVSGINAITYEAYINLNGVRQVFSNSATPSTKTVNANKGDILYGFTASNANLTYADLVLPSSGYYLILSDGTIVKIEEYSSLSLSLTYGGTTWNSSSYINYVPGSSILALLTSLSQGIMLGATGTLVIDGTSRSIVSIFSQVSSVLLYWGSENYKEVLSTGYYDISGSFTPESVTAAVLTDILLPLVPADDLGNGKDIGTSVDRYRTVYARSVNTDTINTGGLGAFLIGQNLRTTDSPTFAGLTVGTINTGYGDNEVYKISKETIAFGTVGGSGPDTVTKQISAMAIDEIRFVNTTGTMASSTQNDYLATLKAPAGGTYLIIGGIVTQNNSTPVQTGGFLVSGGSNIWSVSEQSDDTRPLNTAVIIRKLTA